MIDSLSSCTEPSCQTDSPNDNLDQNDFKIPKQASAPFATTTTTTSQRVNNSNNRKRNQGKPNIRSRLNYIQQSSYLSRPLLSSSPASFLLTNGGAGGPNGSSASLFSNPIGSRPAGGNFLFDNSSLVNFNGGSAHGPGGGATGGQFALTPDARACVTATYLCVLIVNNTWLDCNLLEMLCNNNGSSSSTLDENPSNRKASGRQQTDSIVADAQNATRWLADAKRDDLGQLESALSGLIAFAGGGEGGDSAREEDEGGGENKFLPARLLIGGSGETVDGSKMHNINAQNSGMPINLLRLAPDKMLLPLKPPDINGNHNNQEEDDGGGGGGAYHSDPVGALATSPLILTARESDQPGLSAVVLLNSNQQFSKTGRVVDTNDEDRNRIIEQYFKSRKHKPANKQQLSEKLPSDIKMKISPLDGRAIYQQQQQQPPTALPMTTPASGLVSSSVATTTMDPSDPSSNQSSSSSLVSWIVRPFRGWSAYSFWPINLIATTSQDIDYPAASINFEQDPVELMQQQQQPQTTQLLRPIDRSEQYNDIATNQTLDQFKQTMDDHQAEYSQMINQKQQHASHEQNRQAAIVSMLPTTTDSFLASESAYQTPTTFAGSLVTAPTTAAAAAVAVASSHQLLGIYDMNNQRVQQQQHRNQQPLISFDDQRQQQQQQQPNLDCDCDETTATTTTTTLVHQLFETNPNECRLYCANVVLKQKQQQLIDAGGNGNQQLSTVMSSGFTTPTTTATTATSSTTTSSTSTASTASSGAKMNPLDVTFLLYTRYHRDLVRELAQFSGNSGGGGGGGGGQQLSQATSGNNLLSPENLVVLGDLIDITNETTLSESRLNSSLPIKIVIHGFGSGGRRPWVTDMVYKLLDYEDVNVIVVDWEKGASLPNYVQAAGNTRSVGHKIALLIRSISSKLGLTGNSFHLIGFSLGAHVAGFAGMEIRNLTSVPRHWINRITGLDPASPLFEGYEANDRLDPSDAQFVDVIHSNGDGVLRGGFGSLQPMGHVDFYPNGGRVQVGCNSVILSALSDIIYGKWQSLCNHRRALNFFMDSFEFNKCRFRSFNCDSYENYLKGECFDCGVNNEKCSYMGYLANYSRGRGKMYLTTHEDAPFCANQLIIKIIGSKGFKTHWGKVEVTLVTVDGKNESFLLSSLNGQTSGGHELANGQKDSSQHNMQSLIVAHPTLVNFTHVLLRYTKYKGWIYSGDESWPIDKVFLMDSDGQVKSFCGFNTILESHITTRLNLEPGNCTIIEPNGNSNHNIGLINSNAVPMSPNQQMGRGASTLSGSSSSPQPIAGVTGGGGQDTQTTPMNVQLQQPIGANEQQQSHLQQQQHLIQQQQQRQQPVPSFAATMLSENEQQDSTPSDQSEHDQEQQLHQKAQSTARSPRLLALIIQSNGGVEAKKPANLLSHGQATFSRMASGGGGQQQQQQQPAMHQVMAF